MYCNGQLVLGADSRSVY